MKNVRGLFFLLWALAYTTWAAQPVVSNIRASQRSGTKLVDIYYDVSDAGGHSQTVQVYVSADSSFKNLIPAATFSGAVGAGVMPGVNKHIVWDAGRDWSGQFVPECKVRIVSSDGNTPNPPSGMVYIPAGSFQMGDNFYEGNSDELPVHTVYLDGFFMDQYEVSHELWLDVRGWGMANGYSMDSGASQGAGHPRQNMNWYSAVKWCNARSEKEGLTPVYYTDATQTQVYRSNDLSIKNDCVKWNANGYRLPTEAEWEKAARGARQGNRYPWGDTRDGSKANYYNSGAPFASTTPCGYYNGSQTPAGADMANGYGLYDMAGNVMEWCWDWYGSAYYGAPDACNNPRGPDTGLYRLCRGGSYYVNWSNIRCSLRAAIGPESRQSFFGFRCVRGH